MFNRMKSLNDKSEMLNANKEFSFDCVKTGLWLVWMSKALCLYIECTACSVRYRSKCARKKCNKQTQITFWKCVIWMCRFYVFCCNSNLLYFSRRFKNCVLRKDEEKQLHQQIHADDSHVWMIWEVGQSQHVVLCMKLNESSKISSEL